MDGELLPRLLERLCDVQTLLPDLLARLCSLSGSPTPAPSISDSTVTLLARGSHAALRNRLADGIHCTVQYTVRTVYTVLYIRICVLVIHKFI